MTVRISNNQRYQNALSDGYLLTYEFMGIDRLSELWHGIAQREGFPFVQVHPTPKGMFVAATLYTIPGDRTALAGQIAAALKEARQPTKQRVNVSADGSAGGPFSIPIASDVAARIARLTGVSFPLTGVYEATIDD